MCFTEFHRPFFTEIYISQPALLILLGIKIFTSFIHPGYICIDETLGFPQIKLKRHLIVWKINKKKIHQHERLWGFKYRHFKSWADHVESNIYIYMACQVVLVVKNLPADAGDLRETRVGSLGWEDSLEEGMATHSSILAWKIPWIEEPGGLRTMGSQRVRHDWRDLAHSWSLLYE